MQTLFELKFHFVSHEALRDNLVQCSVLQDLFFVSVRVEINLSQKSDSHLLSYISDIFLRCLFGRLYISIRRNAC